MAVTPGLLPQKNCMKKQRADFLVPGEGKKNKYSFGYLSGVFITVWRS
jgi:hypothetical protein